MTKRENGSTRPNTGRGAGNGGGRLHFGASQGSRNPGEFGEIPRLGIILDYVVAAGDAVMVSSTSDGGAMVVTVLAGDSREKAYASGQMELNGVFELIEQAYTPSG